MNMPVGKQIFGMLVSNYKILIRLPFKKCFEKCGHLLDIFYSSELNELF